MQTREFKCFNKLLSVCNNRGFADLGAELIKSLGSKHLQQSELKELSNSFSKGVRFGHKLTFLNQTNFANECTHCHKMVDKGDPAFLQGKALYHVLCGLSSFKDEANSNIYYKKWAAQVKPIENYEEED